jgi:hypothetical protein
MNQTETWKPVPEFEEVYEVSDLGKVRRIKASSATHAGRLLKPLLQRDGYLRVHLKCRPRRKKIALHRLVAEVFIPNPLFLPEVNHLGPKSDCRASMLEWRSTQGHKLYHVKTSIDGVGVSFDKANKRWVSYYNPKPNVFIRVGRFRTKKEALAARRAAIATLYVPN